jgi:hypothetical protein
VDVAQAVGGAALVDEAERLRKQLVVDTALGAVGPRAVDAEDGVLGRDLRVLGAQRLGVRHDHELVAQPIVVGEGEAAVAALDVVAVGGQAVGPEAQGGVGGDAQLDRVDHPGAGAAAGAPANSNQVRMEPGVPCSSPK